MGPFAEVLQFCGLVVLLPFVCSAFEWDIESSVHCMQPIPVNNLSGIVGLTGTELVSHRDYFSKNLSIHENDINCNWNIRGDHRSSLITIIRVVSLELEDGGDCGFDALSINYVRFNSSENVTRKLCGDLNNKIMLASSDANINFRTDNSIARRGFHLQWTFANISMAMRLAETYWGCMEPIRTRSHSNIPLIYYSLSSGGNLLYVNSDFTNAQEISPLNKIVNCDWTITPATEYMVLTVGMQAVENSTTKCQASKLNISVAINDFANYTSLTDCPISDPVVFLVNTSINLNLRAVLASQTPNMRVTWIDLSKDQVAQIQPCVVEGKTMLVAFMSCLTGRIQSEHCSDLETLQNQTLDGVGVYQGGRLSSHREFSTTTNSSYYSNMNCSWTISAPSSQYLVHVKVLFLDLEFNDLNPGCPFDYLRFRFISAVSNSSEELLACSGLHKSWFTSTSNVELRFVTDSSISKDGFQIVWFFVPLSDAERLLRLENVQGFACPEVNGDNGTLSVVDYKPNSLCEWRWTLRDDERMDWKVEYYNLDYRDNGKGCVRAYDKLSVQVIREPQFLINSQIEYLCGTTGGSATLSTNARLYHGVLVATFTTDGSVQGNGFRIVYRKTRHAPALDCPQVKIVNAYVSKLQGRLTATSRDETCTWTFAPKSDQHFLQISTISVTRRSHPEISLPGISIHRDRNCESIITMSSNTTLTVTPQLLHLMYYTRRLERDLFVNSTKRRMCTGSSTYDDISVASAGPVEVQIHRVQSWHSLDFDISVENIPFPASKRKVACSNQTVVDTRHRIVEQLPESRTVSVRQLAIESATDCEATAIRMQADTSNEHPGIPRKFRLSLNCSLRNGTLQADDGLLNFYTLSCDEYILIDYRENVAWLDFQTTGTGGFTLIVEELRWIYEGRIRCPRNQNAELFKKAAWTFSLPLMTKVASTDSILSFSDWFYCRFTFVPEPGYEIHVQLSLAFENGNQEQLCRQLSTETFQPKIKFIKTAPNKEDTKLSICEHNIPGMLRVHDSVRVKHGESLTVDITSAKVYGERNAESNSDLLGNSGLEAMITARQVEICERLPSSGEQWQVSPDGTQLLSTVTVAPNNTQTDCKLQLDAFTAADIANRSKTFKSAVSKLSTVGCWNLEVKLDKFSTVCGLKQLVLTVSHWDSLAASIEHSQREICSSDLQFSSQSVSASLQAAGSGLSLQYSGVRSGFRARFSISACRESSVESGSLKPMSGSGRISTPLTAILVLLALCNVLVLLFAFRLKIAGRARVFLQGRSG